MARKLPAALVAIALAGTQLPAQQFPPGYVDPAPLLAAAAKEIGEANLKCITFSGTGYSGAVGQTFENAANIDWPRIDSMANYTRTINWETGTSKETFDRKPGLNPASWKYGSGWQGGTPTQKYARQTHIVNGKFAWHMDGDGPPVAVPPEDGRAVPTGPLAEPARIPQGRPPAGRQSRAFWRWEQIEKGRDGNVVAPEKMHVVTITMFGKFRVDATINGQNQIQRIKTTVNDPTLGDFNIEQESTQPDDIRQREMADRLAFAPRMGRQLAVLPPEHRPQRLRREVPERAAERLRRSGSRAGVGETGDVPDARSRSKRWPTACICSAAGPPTATWWSSAISSPSSRRPSTRSAAWRSSSRSRSWLPTSRFAGSSSLTRTSITSEACARTTTSARPSYSASKNIEFLNNDVLVYEPRTVKPDIVSLMPPTELAEGYNYEAIQENFVITDDSRILRVYYVQPLQHVAGMLMAYLPAERIAFEADLFDTHEPPRAAQLPAMRSLFNQVQRMKLDVATLAPVHGKPVPWSTFVSAVKSLGGAK